MLENSLVRAADLADRHERAFTIGAAVWFWAGIAIYAEFIPLPGVPETVKQGFFWSSVAANAFWWGFLRQAIDKRRVRLKDNQTNG